MSKDKKYLGFTIVRDLSEGDYIFGHSFTSIGYDFIASKITKDEKDFALYSLKVKVILPWEYYFNVLSMDDAFEVTQKSSLIETFNREEYIITVKRSLSHIDYVFPETLRIKLVPQTGRHLPFGISSPMPSKTFDEYLEKEKKELENVYKLLEKTKQKATSSVEVEEELTDSILQDPETQS